MSKAARGKARRFSLRLTDFEISRIERAAMTHGQSSAEFIGDAAVRAAEDIIVDSREILLSEDGFIHFMDLISRPPEVVPAIVELMKRAAPWETDG